MSKLPRIWRLPDGDPLLLRPIGPRDKGALETFARGLSDASRYLRFHAQVTQLPANASTVLTHVDGYHHFAVVATHPADRAIVGVGRMIREAEDPSVAEIAITVGDAYQQRGLGTVLLRELVDQAPARRIGVLRAYVLAANVGMRHLLASSGLPLSERESGTMDLDLVGRATHAA
ncbi:MAG: GNAT family N-acetyltransferase [Polyangiaceae bacterium]|nr:GNAT family N-acetyltransferase [Polyangiaceae bacterium]